MTIDPLSVPYAGEAILEAPLREIFPDERRCFVPWLEDQLDLLGHAVCLDLEWEATEAEAPIGGEYPRADLLCTDRSSRERVIIEAQLGHLDNEHIGKAPVYLNAFESRSMIWVVPRSGASRKAAVRWLNRVTQSEYRFWLVGLQLVIGEDGLLSPRFGVIEGPGAESC